MKTRIRFTVNEAAVPNLPDSTLTVLGRETHSVILQAHRTNTPSCSHRAGIAFQDRSTIGSCLAKNYREVDLLQSENLAEPWDVPTLSKHTGYAQFRQRETINQQPHKHLACWHEDRFLSASIPSIST